MSVNFGVQDGVSISMEKLNEIRSVSKLDKIDPILVRHVNFAREMNISEDDNVKWDVMIGKDLTTKYVNYLKENITYSENLITSYYTEGIFTQRTKAYDNLEPVTLDGKVLDTPTYNHSSTTGRTSITSGFNFLTLSKEKRKSLAHKDKDKTLVEIDLKSCEPTFYLKALGKNIDTADVYEDISKKLNMDITDRQRFKRGILSVMYGARDRTSKNILRCNFSDLEKIKKYFEIEKFKTSLTEQFKTQNLIYNYYGRPICYDSSLVNYWIQSSAVDYCSLAFSNLISQMSLTPCFFVHDSVTIAVDKKDIGDVLNISSVTDNYSGIEIPVEVSIPSR